MPGSEFLPGGVSAMPFPSPPCAEAISLNELLRRYNLPIGAHIHSPHYQGTHTNKPLLLYKKTTSAKVRAQSLLSTNNKLTPVGPELVIPHNYTGWFSVLDSKGHPSAVCYSSISQLLKKKPNCFLCKDDVTALLVSNSHGETEYTSTLIRSGEVLKLLSVSSHRHTKYAKCFTFRKQTVLVALSCRGRFYLTAQCSTEGRDRLFLLSQLIKRFTLPMSAKLVSGYMPRPLCSFTGLLRLSSHYSESVVIACTMTGRAEATFLEMDTQSTFLLSPITDPMHCKTPVYLKTLSYCQDKSADWQRQIKTSHHMTESRTIALSEKFTDRTSRAQNVEDVSHLAKLASKVKRMKSPYTKRLFEKKISRENTYVPESRVQKGSRPLPDPIRNTEADGHSVDSLDSYSRDYKSYSEDFSYKSSEKCSQYSLEQSEDEEENLYAEIEEMPHYKQQENTRKDSGMEDIVDGENTEDNEYFDNSVSEYKEQSFQSMLSADQYCPTSLNDKHQALNVTVEFTDSLEDLTLPSNFTTETSSSYWQEEGQELASINFNQYELVRENDKENHVKQSAAETDECNAHKSFLTHHADKFEANTVQSTENAVSDDLESAFSGDSYKVNETHQREVTSTHSTEEAYTSMITIIENEASGLQTSISIIKQNEDVVDESILTKGNKILIKVHDDIPSNENTLKRNSLRKCLSVSSINILSDDSLILAPPPTTIASDTHTYSNGNVTNECYLENSHEIEILSASNELIIPCNKERNKKLSSDSDSKSVDSGNATEDSFDNDSLDGDSDGVKGIESLDFDEESRIYSSCSSDRDSSEYIDHELLSPLFESHLRSLVEQLSLEHFTTPSVSAVPYQEELEEPQGMDFLEKSNQLDVIEEIDEEEMV